MENNFRPIPIPVPIPDPVPDANLSPLFPFQRRNNQNNRKSFIPIPIGSPIQHYRCSPMGSLSPMGEYPKPVPLNLDLPLATQKEIKRNSFTIDDHDINLIKNDRKKVRQNTRLLSPIRQRLRTNTPNI
jgi:hypothetical protein